MCDTAAGLRGDLTLDQRLRVGSSRQKLVRPRVALTQARRVHSVAVSGTEMVPFRTGIVAVRQWHSGSCIRRTPGGEQR